LRSSSRSRRGRSTSTSRLGRPAPRSVICFAHASGLPVDGEEPIAEPGRRRIYSNTGIELAARLLEERAEMPFADYFAHAVVRPLGLSGRLAGSPAHAYRGPLGDLLAVGRELLRPTLVAPETLGEATTVQFPGLGGVPARPRPDGAERLGPHLRAARREVATLDGLAQLRADVRPLRRERYVPLGRSRRGVACGVLTDRRFGDWAKEAWPRFSDAVLADVA
jgi:CubicO group peptidase (beta-lactamase class C family)